MAVGRRDGMSIQVHSNSKEFTEGLKAFLGSVSKFTSADEARISGIMQRGIIRNHQQLAQGYHLRAVGDKRGFVGTWNQIRHPLTRKLREAKGLHDVFPMLHYTGKLQGIINRGGRAKRYGNELLWTPAAGGSDLKLLKSHEWGLTRVSDKSNKNPGFPAGMKVPPRASIFWSLDMANEFIDYAEGKAASQFKKAPRGVARKTLLRG